MLSFPDARIREPVAAFVCLVNESGQSERWQSGRLCNTGNVVYGKPYRGFESLPLR